MVGNQNFLQIPGNLCFHDGIYIYHTAGAFVPWKKFPPEGESYFHRAISLSEQSKGIGNLPEENTIVEARPQTTLFIAREYKSK